jgi:hypothetical protein
MTDKEIIDKNILIAKWLGWEVKQVDDYIYKCYILKKEIGSFNFSNEYNDELPITDINIVNEKLLDLYCNPKNNNHFKFYSDSNLQWLCLEKIAKECNLTIWHISGFGYFKSFNSKQELFEAIVNYIKNEKNGTN